MEKIVHCQTILTLKELDKLKKKAGTGETKEALRTAVDHYLNNPLIEVKHDAGEV